MKSNRLEDTKQLTATITTWYSYNRYGYCKVRKSDVLYYFDAGVFKEGFKPKEGKKVYIQVCGNVVINLKEYYDTERKN